MTANKALNRIFQWHIRQKKNKEPTDEKKNFQSCNIIWCQNVLTLKTVKVSVISPYIWTNLNNHFLCLLSFFFFFKMKLLLTWLIKQIYYIRNILSRLKKENKKLFFFFNPLLKSSYAGMQRKLYCFFFFFFFYLKLQIYSKI